MNKKILGDEGKLHLKIGIDNAANLIKQTLGVEGKTIIYETSEGIFSTKDGATVAREIEFVDKIENMGARMIKEIAANTADLAGDGTTTTTVLAQAIINTCYIQLLDKKKTANEIKSALEKELKLTLEVLKELAIPVKNDVEKLKQIINISSNGDQEIIKVIGDIIDRIGEDSTINLEESFDNTTYSKILEGLSFEKGYISGKLITNKEKNICILENPYILVIDKIKSLLDIRDILNTVINRKESILIILNEIQDDVLDQILYNRGKGLNVGVVRAPHFGIRRNETIEDICCYTGATYVCKDGGVDIDDLDLQHLGKADSCTIHQDITLIRRDNKDNQVLKTRISQIKEHINDTKFDFDIERLKDRLSRLEGGIATIYVGGNTEAEMKEKKDRVEDSIKAVRSAIEEGIVSGGGAALVYCGNKIIANSTILVPCLEEPFKQILTNADVSFEEILKSIINKIDQNKYIGFNVKTLEVCDMINEGIIDSHKVLRVALENAVSLAITFIMSKGLIVRMEEEEKLNIPFNPFNNNLNQQ